MSSRACSRRAEGSRWSPPWRSVSDSGCRFRSPIPVTRPRSVRRRYAFGARFLTVLSLVVYGWIIHWVGWSKMVRTNWGLGGLVLVDDFVVFLPYLSIQLLVWWGLFFAERALQIRQGPHAASPLGRYMVLKARQSLGLILPVILLVRDPTRCPRTLLSGLGSECAGRATRDRRLGDVDPGGLALVHQAGVADALPARRAAAPPPRPGSASASVSGLPTSWSGTPAT